MLDRRTLPGPWETSDEIDRFLFVTRVAKSIKTRKRDFVSAVPKQALLPMLKLEGHINRAALQRQRRGHRFLDRLSCFLTVLNRLFRPRNDSSERGAGRRLVLWRTPG